MSYIGSNQQMMRSVWQEHLRAEFEARDPEAALATLSENPYVLLIPSGAALIGKQAVRDFYVKRFIPYIPSDLELIPVSQIISEDRIIDELVIRFTHSLQMDWMLPDIPPTNRKVEFALVTIHQFEQDKVASERLYWDQSTVLTQLGILYLPVAATGTKSAANLLEIANSRMMVR